MLLGAADSLNSHLFLALSYFRGDVPPQAKIQMCPDRGFQKKTHNFGGAKRAIDILREPFSRSYGKWPISRFIY